LWWGGLTGIVVLVVGLLAYAADTLSLYEGIDEELRDTVVAARTIADGASTTTGTLALPAPSLPGIVLQVYGPSGELLGEHPAAAQGPEVDPRAVLAHPSGPPYDLIVRLAPPYGAVDPGAGAFGTVVDPDGFRWRLYVLPLGSVGQGGASYLSAATPLRRIDVVLATHRRLGPILAAVAALVVLGAGMLLSSRLLRPITALTETAGAIARSRSLRRRVPAGSAHDELERLASTFNAMLDSLEQASLAQQRFVADASHELRAPLAIIQANLELLERRSDLSPTERQEALAEASRETHRLVRLVADLLALARADTGAPLRRRPVELDRVLLEAFQQVRHLAGGRQLSIATLEPALVEGDPDQLKQLLLALVDNALKYTPADGQVTLGLHRSDGMAEVIVRDSGIGIAPHDLPHVFERFYRADPARGRDPGGTGLGLSIAQWIAQQHGGEIVLASTPAKGTTATVRLPLAPETTCAPLPV
jgi:signal transduction histidine kinase